jgi:hypothetical protein
MLARQRIVETGSTNDQRLFGAVRSANVVTISNESGTLWLGGITEFNQYQAFVDWASRSRDAGELLPLPKEFHRHTLHPFRKPDSRDGVCAFL